MGNDFGSRFRSASKSWSKSWGRKFRCSAIHADGTTRRFLSLCERLAIAVPAPRACSAINRPSVHSRCPTTLQAYPHDSLAYYKNLTRRRDLPGLYRYVFELNRLRSWVELGKRLFDQFLQEGGIWHLYGHSWEIEKLGLWNELQEMVNYVRERPGVIYASNSQALQLLEQDAVPVNSLSAE